MSHLDRSTITGNFIKFTSIYSSSISYLFYSNLYSFEIVAFMVSLLIILVSYTENFCLLRGHQKQFLFFFSNIRAQRILAIFPTAFFINWRKWQYIDCFLPIFFYHFIVKSQRASFPLPSKTFLLFFSLFQS